MLSASSFYEGHLPAGEVIALVDAAGWDLACLAGRIWLTEEGGDDVWLAAGEGFALRRSGRCVIEAAAPSVLRLRLAPSPWRRRFAAWCAGLRPSGRLVPPARPKIA